MLGHQTQSRGPCGDHVHGQHEQRHARGVDGKPRHNDNYLCGEQPHDPALLILFSPYTSSLSLSSGKKTQKKGECSKTPPAVLSISYSIVFFPDLSFLFPKYSLIVLAELFDPLVSQRMMGHLLDHLIGNGHISAPARAHSVTCIVWRTLAAMISVWIL